MAITYNITTNFGAKDSLPPGDTNKIVRGSEHTTEYLAIQSALALAATDTALALKAPLASPTFTGTATAASLVIDGKVNEQQYSLAGTVIDPANGTIQYKTLAANTTFTESLSDGDYVTLMIDDGTAYTITWPTVSWVGGSAPTLDTSGYNIIELWQVNGVVYGVFVGVA